MDYDAVVRAAMNARREAMRAEAAQPIALRAPYAGYAASPTGYFSPEMAMLPNPPPMYSPRMGEGYTMEYERRSMPPSPPSGFVYAGYPAFPAAVASGRGVLPYSPVPYAMNGRTSPVPPLRVTNVGSPAHLGAYTAAPHANANSKTSPRRLSPTRQLSSQRLTSTQTASSAARRKPVVDHKAKASLLSFVNAATTQALTSPPSSKGVAVNGSPDRMGSPPSGASGPSSPAQHDQERQELVPSASDAGRLLTAEEDASIRANVRALTTRMRAIRRDAIVSRSQAEAARAVAVQAQVLLEARNAQVAVAKQKIGTLHAALQVLVQRQLDPMANRADEGETSRVMAALRSTSPARVRQAMDGAAAKVLAAAAHRLPNGRVPEELLREAVHIPTAQQIAARSRASGLTEIKTLLSKLTDQIDAATAQAGSAAGFSQSQEISPQRTRGRRDSQSSQIAGQLAGRGRRDSQVSTTTSRARSLSAAKAHYATVPSSGYGQAAPLRTSNMASPVAMASGVDGDSDNGAPVVGPARIVSLSASVASPAPPARRTPASPDNRVDTRGSRGSVNNGASTAREQPMFELPQHPLASQRPVGRPTYGASSDAGAERLPSPAESLRLASAFSVSASTAAATTAPAPATTAGAAVAATKSAKPKLAAPAADDSDSDSEDEKPKPKSKSMLPPFKPAPIADDASTTSTATSGPKGKASRADSGKLSRTASEDKLGKKAPSSPAAATTEEKVAEAKDKEEHHKHHHHHHHHHHHRKSTSASSDDQSEPAEPVKPAAPSSGLATLPAPADVPAAPPGAATTAADSTPATAAATPTMEPTKVTPSSQAPLEIASASDAVSAAEPSKAVVVAAEPVVPPTKPPTPPLPAPEEPAAAPPAPAPAPAETPQTTVEAPAAASSAIELPPDTGKTDPLTDLKGAASALSLFSAEHTADAVPVKGADTPTASDATATMDSALAKEEPVAPAANESTAEAEKAETDTEQAPTEAAAATAASAASEAAAKPKVGGKPTVAAAVKPQAKSAVGGGFQGMKATAATTTGATKPGVKPAVSKPGAAAGSDSKAEPAKPMTWAQKNAAKKAGTDNKPTSAPVPEDAPASGEGDADGPSGGAAPPPPPPPPPPGDAGKPAKPVVNAAAKPAVSKPAVAGAATKPTAGAAPAVKPSVGSGAGAGAPPRPASSANLGPGAPALAAGKPPLGAGGTPPKPGVNAAPAKPTQAKPANLARARSSGNISPTPEAEKGAESTEKPADSKGDADAKDKDKDKDKDAKPATAGAGPPAGPPPPPPPGAPASRSSSPRPGEGPPSAAVLAPPSAGNLMAVPASPGGRRSPSAAGPPGGPPAGPPAVGPPSLSLASRPSMSAPPPGGGAAPRGPPPPGTPPKPASSAALTSAAAAGAGADPRRGSAGSISSLGGPPPPGAGPPPPPRAGSTSPSAGGGPPPPPRPGSMQGPPSRQSSPTLGMAPPPPPPPKKD